MKDYWILAQWPQAYFSDTEITAGTVVNVVIE